MHPLEDTMHHVHVGCKFTTSFVNIDTYLNFTLWNIHDFHPNFPTGNIDDDAFLCLLQTLVKDEHVFVHKPCAYFAFLRKWNHGTSLVRQTEGDHDPGTYLIPQIHNFFGPSSVCGGKSKYPRRNSAVVKYSENIASPPWAESSVEDRNSSEPVSCFIHQSSHIKLALQSLFRVTFIVLRSSYSFRIKIVHSFI